MGVCSIYHVYESNYELCDVPPLNINIYMTGKDIHRKVKKHLEKYSVFLKNGVPKYYTIRVSNYCDIYNDNQVLWAILYKYKQTRGVYPGVVLLNTGLKEYVVSVSISTEEPRLLRPHSILSHNNPCKIHPKSNEISDDSDGSLLTSINLTSHKSFNI